MAKKKQNGAGKKTPTAEQLMQRHFKLIPPLPKGLAEQVCQRELSSTCYLFTFRSGGKRFGYCTECKKVVSLEPKRTESYDDSVNRQRRHNDRGYCPECKARVIFKDSGRGKDKLWDYGKIIVAQKAGNMLLLRFLDVTRSFRHFTLDRIGKNFGDGEVQFHEEHRLFLDAEDKKAYQYTQPWSYFGTNYYSKFYGYEAGDGCEKSGWKKRRSFRTDFNAYGLATIYGLDEKLLEKTGFKYCPISIYDKVSGGYGDYPGFLLKYTLYPAAVEYMMKCGFSEMFAQLQRYKDTGRLLNLRADSPEKLLRLPKHDITMLRKGAFGSNPDAETLEKLQILAPLGLNDSQKLEIVKEESLYFIKSTLKKILSRTTFVKAKNYINKNKRAVISPWFEYADYIKACETLGLDLNEHRILFPSDLREAHDRALALVRAEEEAQRAEMRREEREHRILKEKDTDEAIRKRAKALNKAWGFCSDGIFARPAATLEEIILEGDAQQICVGSSSMRYTERHANGRAFIFFVRHENEPNIPLCTVEITADGTVVQARAYKNAAPSADVSAFLTKWKAYIANKTLKKSA